MLESFTKSFEKLENWIDQQFHLEEEEEPENDHPEEILSYIKKETYLKVEWPEYQKFMEEDWCDECHTAYINGKPQCFVPTNRIFEYFNLNSRDT